MNTAVLGDRGMLPGEQTTKDPMKTRMKLRVIIVAVVILVASGAIAGWVFRYDLILFKTYTDRDRYLPGELVKVTAKFTNLGFVPVSLTFGDSAKAGFAVYSENGSFVCGIGVAALQVITHVRLGPGESVAFGAHWNQTIEDYTQVPYYVQVPYPSNYYVKAFTLSREFHATATTATFAISGDSSS